MPSTRSRSPLTLCWRHHLRPHAANAAPSQTSPQPPLAYPPSPRGPAQSSVAEEPLDRAAAQSLMLHPPAPPLAPTPAALRQHSPAARAVHLALPPGRPRLAPLVDLPPSPRPARPTSPSHPLLSVATNSGPQPRPRAAAAAAHPQLPPLLRVPPRPAWPLRPHVTRNDPPSCVEVTGVRIGTPPTGTQKDHQPGHRLHPLNKRGRGPVAAHLSCSLREECVLMPNYRR